MTIILILLVGLVLIAITLQKIYTQIPRTELKRRARQGDEFAGALYQAAAYGLSLQLLLWGIIGLASAGFFVVLARSVPAWLAVAVSLVIVWLGFAWLPNTRVTQASNALARYLTPPVTWLVSHLYPILSRLADWVRRHRSISVHSGMYQKEDLLSLLNKQKTQHDNRITDNELRIAANALTFGDKTVRDIMTPRRVVKTVSATDTVGPLLMNELHNSGHSRFPVYQDKPDNVVGILYVRDLVAAKAGGRVRDLMSSKLYYVHEEQSLNGVLQAFLRTKHHLFIVVNSFEEVVGIVTIEDVLEQIIGKPIIDEFDRYDDMRAVAALKARHEHKNQVPEEVTTPGEKKPTTS